MGNIYKNSVCRENNYRFYPRCDCESSGTNVGFLSPLGTLLLNLLSLVALPVIFLTVVLAVNQMNVTQLGRIGGKLIIYYTATTAAAVADWTITCAMVCSW